MLFLYLWDSAKYYSILNCFSHIGIVQVNRMVVCIPITTLVRNHGESNNHGLFSSQCSLMFCFRFPLLNQEINLKGHWEKKKSKKDKKQGLISEMKGSTVMGIIYFWNGNKSWPWCLLLWSTGSDSTFDNGWKENWQWGAACGSVHS